MNYHDHHGPGGGGYMRGYQLQDPPMAEDVSVT